jgi:hypothetical protein
MRRPYAFLAVRTDPVDSAPGRRARAVLQALPEHPLASTLRFCDPCRAAPELLDPRN